MSEESSEAKVLKVNCPICKKETAWGSTKFSPFCSERCALIDLGSWAEEKYSVVSKEEAPSESELHPTKEND